MERERAPPYSHPDGDAVFAKGSCLDQLVHAVDREVAGEAAIKVGSGRDTHCMDTHNLVVEERRGGGDGGSCLGQTTSLLTH